MKSRPETTGFFAVPACAVRVARHYGIIKITTFE
jgi:hypothetical protein